MFPTCLSISFVFYNEYSIIHFSWPTNKLKMNHKLLCGHKCTFMMPSQPSLISNTPHFTFILPESWMTYITRIRSVFLCLSTSMHYCVHSYNPYKHTPVHLSGLNLIITFLGRFGIWILKFTSIIATRIRSSFGTPPIPTSHAHLSPNNSFFLESTTRDHIWAFATCSHPLISS